MIFLMHGIIEDHPLKSGGWEILRSFAVQSRRIAGHTADLPDGRVALRDDGLLHIHAGYRCDGPSVPALVPRWIIDADDEKLAAAAWVHDALYHLCRAGLIDDWRAFRAQADLLFLEMMTANGVPRWRAKIAYWAVRLRGAGSARPQPDVEHRVRVVP